MNRNIFSVVTTLAILLLAVVSFVQLQVLPPAGDEMVFIRITDNISEYRSYPSWWSLDGETMPSEISSDPNAEEDFNTAYDTNIWHHPPVANYIAYPFVKLMYDDSSVQSIYDSVTKLRMVAWALLMTSVFGICYILEKRGKSNKYLLLPMPILILATMVIFFAKPGNNWFYHDTFMVLFLVIALVVRETKYKKFIYIPLTLMVLSKLYGFVFLIPFAIENKKTALCGFALIPYLVWAYVRTGSFLFPFQHFYQLADLRNIFPHSILNRITAIVHGSKAAWWLLAISIPSSVFLVIKKEWFYFSLGIISLVVGLCWFGAYYQMLPLILVTPILLCRVIELTKVGANQNCAEIEVLS